MKRFGLGAVCFAAVVGAVGLATPALADVSLYLGGQRGFGFSYNSRDDGYYGPSYYSPYRSHYYSPGFYSNPYYRPYRSFGPSFYLDVRPSYGYPYHGGYGGYGGRYYHHHHHHHHCD